MMMMWSGREGWLSTLSYNKFAFSGYQPSRPAAVAEGAGGAGRAAGGAAAAAVVVVAAALVALHVAADAEGLAAPGERALEGLLARVRVAVDAQRAGPREGLVARLADVAVLALRERRRRRGRDVVVVLPRVAAGGAESNRHGHRRRESLWETG